MIQIFGNDWNRFIKFVKRDAVLHLGVPIRLGDPTLRGGLTLLITKIMNDWESIWKRIVSSSEQIELRTKRGRRLQYKIVGDTVVWIGLETTMKNLVNQSKGEIEKCLESRMMNLNPSEYPGAAPSYKWALLNHPSIWIQK